MSDCDACALRSRCLAAKTPTRTIYRWEHEAVLERHRARMQGTEALMRRRAELAEHPFGTSNAAPATATSSSAASTKCVANGA